MASLSLTCTLEEVKAQVEDKEACLKAVEREISVLLHPKYTASQLTGVKKELDALSRLHSKELGGMVVAYDKVRLVSPRGWLFDTNPFIHVRVAARFFVFCPKPGDSLKAVVRKKSTHHLGCLAHSSYNVAVPRPPSEAVDSWAGTLAAEGDTLTLTVLFTSLTKYHMPYIRAAIHPDCVKELKEREKAAAATLEAGGEELSTNLPNKRTVFDDDSGISSNEAEEGSKAQKRKRSEMDNDEEEEDEEAEKIVKEEGEGESSKRKRRRKDNGGTSENTSSEIGERNANKGNKRKRNEEEEEEEEVEKVKKKKKRKRESSAVSDISFDTTLMKKEIDIEEVSLSPKKKKKKKKKKEENRQDLEEEEEQREAERPIRIKMEKMSSDEAEETRAKKKKKNKEEMTTTTMERIFIKEEKVEENERRKSKSKELKRLRKEKQQEEMMMVAEKEANQLERDEEGEETGTATRMPKKTTLIKKKKIKVEKLSEDEGRGEGRQGDLPIPLFMIKREKSSDHAKNFKKEKG